MKVEFVSRVAVPATLKRLMNSHDKFYWAVAWASDNPTTTELLNRESKIGALVIGTHFYQTPPDFLERFKHVAAVRVMPPDDAVFHPKIYLFVSQERSALLIGSANFTHSAMTSNIEGCCLIEGNSGEPPFRDAHNFIVKDCWSKAKSLDEEFLRSYRIRYEDARTVRNELARFVPLKRPRLRTSQIDPLEMSWAEFCRRVHSETYFASRLEVLARARTLLEGVDSFSALNEMQRKAIAGTFRRNGKGPYSLPWGLFGRMASSGIFTKKINANSPEISRALDRIPPTGVLTHHDYRRFVEQFKHAFAGDRLANPIGMATRLLAMKRPDYFVCVSSANKKQLYPHFGLAATSMTLDTYWSDLIEPITLSQWWRVPRPTGIEGRIWDGRAALLDALFLDQELAKKIL